ncbi:MAG: hypothetical protein AAF515_08995 [Pseudomonadota bacterium]
MTTQLRQLALVARELEPVLQDLTAIFGIERAYVDPGVGVFGLENTLMPIGRNFLEVVAPVEDGTAGGRYLERRGGDGGYMVITQQDSRAAFDAIRGRALDAGVRVAWETERGGWNNCQLHPGDLRAAFLELECDEHNDFDGYWHPVGGLGWEDKVRQDVTVDWLAAELQGPDPVELADLWGRVLGLPVARDGSELLIELNNASLRFVEASDGRGPGLGGIDLKIADRDHVLREARARDCYVSDERVDVCGIRWRLVD